MNFDNLYKLAKTFLVFSVGLLTFSFSIKIWTGGMLQDCLESKKL